VNVDGQIAWAVELQLNVYTMQLIIIQLQLNQNNSFLTTMQFHYNHTHDVMLMSLIVIHILKSNTWHYEDFWTYIFLKYWFASSIMIINDGLNLWHMAQ